MKPHPAPSGPTTLTNQAFVADSGPRSLRRGKKEGAARQACRLCRPRPLQVALTSDASGPLPIYIYICIHTYLCCEYIKVFENTAGRQAHTPSPAQRRVRDLLGRGLGHRRPDHVPRHRSRPRSSKLHRSKLRRCTSQPDKLHVKRTPAHG